VYRIAGKPVPVGRSDEMLIVPHPVPVPAQASGEAADVAGRS
jgi:hypothetical protein